MAHLAFHEDLRCDPVYPQSGYVWSDCLWLQDPDYAATATFVARFVKGILRNEKVDYGLLPDLDSFAEGEYIARHPLVGLACASYVAAVLKGAGFDVIDLSTWKYRPEDDVWSDQVLDMLRRYAPARAAGLEGQRAPFRVRPDEVVRGHRAQPARLL